MPSFPAEQRFAADAHAAGLVRGLEPDAFGMPGPCRCSTRTVPFALVKQAGDSG